MPTSLYTHLIDRSSADSQEVAHGVILDFDAEGNVVGIDIDRGSKLVDLARLEADSLPIPNLPVTNSA